MCIGGEEFVVLCLMLGVDVGMCLVESLCVGVVVLLLFVEVGVGYIMVSIGVVLFDVVCYCDLDGWMCVVDVVFYLVKLFGCDWVVVSMLVG